MSNLTKKALLQAFGELLQEKPFNKISIADLTAKCGLSRMTFYYHFNDIYELMIWGLKTQLNDVTRDLVNYDNWKTAYLRIMNFAVDRGVYIKKIFQTIKQEHLEHHLNEIAVNMVVSVIDDRRGDRPLSENDKLFTAHLCSHVLVGTLITWVNLGMKEKPEVIVKKVGCLLEGMIEKTLRGYE